MIEEDDRDAGLAVDAATCQRDPAVKLRGDGLKSADVPA
jgi:hypothetical protein